MLMQKMEMCKIFAETFVYFFNAALKKSFYRKPYLKKSLLLRTLLALSSFKL